MYILLSFKFISIIFKYIAGRRYFIKKI
jgi:hypothetical protein